jgi:hypothetical protein
LTLLPEWGILETSVGEVVMTGVTISPGPPQAQSTAQHPFRRPLGRSMAWEGVFVFKRSISKGLNLA